MQPLFSQAHPPKSVCLLRLSAIGDVCHALAVVQLMQRHWPDTKITWIIGKTEYSLLEGAPEIEFIVFDKQAGISGILKLAKKLLLRRFDVLLHMQMSIRASFLSLLVRSKLRLGFDKPRAKDCQWLFTNRKIAHQAEQHVLDSFLGFTQALGIRDTNVSWNMPLRQCDQDWAVSIQKKSRTLVISPASSVSVRNWHAAGYVAITKYAIERYGMQVFLCGANSKQERAFSDYFAKHYPNKVTDLIGKTNLKQMLALISLADLVIAPDSGPAHIATMVDTPVLSLFANTNPLRAAPYRSKSWVVNQYPAARKRAFKEKETQASWSKRVWDEDAMHLISIDQVKRMLDKLLAEKLQTVAA